MQIHLQSSEYQTVFVQKCILKVKYPNIDFYLTHHFPCNLMTI